MIYVSLTSTRYLVPGIRTMYSIFYLLTIISLDFYTNTSMCVLHMYIYVYLWMFNPLCGIAHNKERGKIQNILKYCKMMGIQKEEMKDWSQH